MNFQDVFNRIVDFHDKLMIFSEIVTPVESFTPEYLMINLHIVFLLGFFWGRQNLLLCKFVLLCNLSFVLDQILGGKAKASLEIKQLQGDCPFRPFRRKPRTFNPLSYGKSDCTGTLRICNAAISFIINHPPSHRTQLEGEKGEELPPPARQ